MGEKISEEAMDLLSDEERAALEADEGAGDDDAGKKNDEEEKTGENETKAEEEARLKAEEDVRLKEEEDARVKAEEEANKKEGKDKGDEPTPVTPVIPPFQLKAGDKTAEAIDAELTALDEKFEEGDITLKDYNAKRDELTREKWTAETYEDINRQVAAQSVDVRWKQAQQDFYAENETFSTNRHLNAAFVSEVNALLASEEGKKMTDAALLKAARKTVEESLGIGKKEEPKADDDREKEKREALAAAKKKEAEKGKDGASIRDLPLAQETEFDDKFDALDKLEGEDFENAVAQMSDAERKAYAHRG